MKLIDHIKEHHNGVVSQFAKHEGFHRQQIDKYIKEGWWHVIIIESKLELVPVKKELKRVNYGQDK